MASNLFVGTYQLYKKQTDKLALWLLDSAEQCGYKADSLAAGKTANGAVGSVRLKGKARKQARSKEVPTAQCSSSAKGPTFRIRVSQFVDLARAIVGSKITVPLSVVKLVHKTVELRRKFVQFYETQAGLEGANSKHLHFIGVLEEVLEILRPQYAPVPKKISEAVSLGSTDESRERKVDGLDSRFSVLEVQELAERKLDGLDNRFNALQVEESAELDLSDDQPLVSAPDETRQPLTKPRRQVEYEAESDDEELFFAIYCLFADLFSVRLYLQEIWEDFKSGGIDLVNASVVTNTAFDLVRCAAEGICKTEPRLSSAEALITLFFAYVCSIRGVDSRYRERPDDLFNYKMVDVAQWLYLPTFILLDSFCDVIQPNHIPQSRRGHFGTYNPNADRNSMSFRQKLAEDKVIVTEILPEFCLLGQSKAEHPGLDEMTRGLSDMYRSKKVSLWLCFATQIFLDINHALRGQVGIGFLELQTAGQTARAMLSRTLNTPRHSMNWPRSNDQSLRDALSYVDTWILSDEVNKIRRRLLDSDYALGGVVKPYYLLTSHPLLCGLMKFSLALIMRESGSAIAASWGSILHVAHLYHALRQSSNLEVSWPDIELFISINSAEKVFVGNLPTNLEDCLKRYYLISGTAPESFAKDREEAAARRRGRRDYVPYSKKGPKSGLLTSPIFEIFKHRYLRQGSVAWTVHNIEALFSEISLANPRHLVIRNRWNRSHDLNNLQLLICLRVAMNCEIPRLNYDYFSMHYRCLDLLRTLHSELDEMCVHLYGPNYIERDDQVAFMAGYLITQAAIAEKSANSSIELRGEKIESKLFSKASSVVKKLIVTAGDREVQKVGVDVKNISTLSFLS